MQPTVQIILIIALAIVLIIAIYLNRGRLKRLGIKANDKGFKIEAQMTDNSKEKPEGDKSKSSKVSVEQISQKGDRHKIRIDSKDAKVKNIKQNGSDNNIDIG